MVRQEGSVGIVKPQFFDFDELKLDCGVFLKPVRLAYETYGSLNAEKSNAVLVFHALSGDAHAAGRHRASSRKNGWYDIAIGPGKTLDTDKFFVICVNVIGGCRGSTGPSSLNPKTGQPYGLDFPILTVRDMVRAQKKLLDRFGIRKLSCIIGGSMGGMQALQWLIEYPDSAEKAVVIATPARQNAMNIVFNDLGRKAIMNDPDWKRGNYYGKGQPRRGLALARQIGHITYLSQDTLERKFGRKTRDGKGRAAKFGAEFEVQSYFRYKGNSFVRRFDANSYLYITDAIDHFDLTDGGTRSLASLFSGVKAKILLVSFASDWLYPPEQVEELFSALAEAGVPSAHKKLDLPYGHDSFLIYNNTLGNALQAFIAKG